MNKRSELPRRSFLKGLSLAVPAAMTGPGVVLAQAQPGKPSSSQGTRTPPQELAADLVIIGGGVGGCAAALAAARSGLRVIMTEETDWIGGQLTAQAIPPDENPWIETFGGTRSYLNLRQQIREYYLRNYPLTAEARANPYLNPGNGWVSRLCHEPRVSLAVLQQLLAPYTSGRKVLILLRHKAVDAATNGDRVEAVRVRSLESGNDVILRAPYFADATELGDLLPLTKTEYVTGAESQKATGEPHAPAVAAPQDMQSFTCCFAMDYVHGEDHTIEKPREYEFWRDFVPALKPPWPGRLLAWEYGDPANWQGHQAGDRPRERHRAVVLSSNRRQVAIRSPAPTLGDISLVNWPQNDYMLGNLCEVSAEEAARHLARAKAAQPFIALLAPDRGAPSGRRHGLEGDTAAARCGRHRGRPDKVSLHPREPAHPGRVHGPRTARLDRVPHEGDRGEARRGAGCASSRIRWASAATGLICIPARAGDNSIDISSLPYQIPLGALIPQRVENLLPACKNLGVTHITNGCYRQHPPEWNIGEAAGVLAAFCLVEEAPAPRGAQTRRAVERTAEPVDE